MILHISNYGSFSEFRFFRKGQFNSSITVQAHEFGSGQWEIPDIAGVIPSARLIGVELQHMQPVAVRSALLLRIAALWHGDWTAMNFDGRTGAGWIRDAVNGTLEDLAKLDADLSEMEKAYE